MNVPEELSRFRPILDYDELENSLHGHIINPKVIKNNNIYAWAKILTSSAKPTEITEFDRDWNCFYLPIKRDGQFVTKQFHVNEYQEKFYLNLGYLGFLEVMPGTDDNHEFKEIFSETLRFSRLIKETANCVLQETVPYDWRSGKIKSKHLLEKLMSEEEKTRILTAHNQQLQKELHSVSLDHWINAIAICYNAKDGSTSSLTPTEIYKIWSYDFENPMNYVNDPSNREEFMEWSSNSTKHKGHPFMFGRTFSFYPPTQDQPRYSFGYSGYKNFDLDIVEALIAHKIPFVYNGLEEKLDYLTGKANVDVNQDPRTSVEFFPGDENSKGLFPYITWDPLPVLEWNR